MTVRGRYHEDSGVAAYALPQGWHPVDCHVLDDALSRALDAWGRDAADRVRAYYDPSSDYAGGLLTQVPESDPGYVDAADLFAVTTLSMRIHPKVARALTTENSATRQALTRALNPSRVPTTLPITALDQEPGEPGEVLAFLESAYIELRTARSTSSNAWVFAAKMCARKRPHLAPVRDRVVCELLNGGPLRRGGVGSFQVDIQVFAYIMSSPETTRRLLELRSEVTRRGVELEKSDLRLLDVVLWTRGIGHWTEG